MLNHRHMRQVISAISIITLLTLSLLLSSPTSAAATINVSPASGTVGTSVTVTGTVDANGNTFEIQWDGAAITSGSAPSGSTNITSTFSIPNTTGGVHTVTLKDTATQVTASTTVTVNPAITVTPATGSVGTIITVNGSGFNASETGVTINYDGTPTNAVVTVSSSGSWSTTFNIPDSPSSLTHSVSITRTIMPSNTARRGLCIQPNPLCQHHTHSYRRQHTSQPEPDRHPQLYHYSNYRSCRHQHHRHR
ncbi:MAG: IPT/TIG domain-containing protein [Chloroflexota bacterium]